MKTTLDYKLAFPLFRHFFFPIVLALLAIAGQIAYPLFHKQSIDLTASFFQYVLMSQFTHLNWAHLGLNLMALGIMTQGLSHWMTPSQHAFSLLFGWLWVAFYLSVLEPLNWYCGLSGALHASFACQWTWAWGNPHPPKRWPWVGLGVGLLFKLGYEASVQSARWSPVIGGTIAIEAHRGGAIGGFLLGVLGLLYFRKTQQQGHHTQAQKPK